MDEQEELQEDDTEGNRKRRVAVSPEGTEAEDTEGQVRHRLSAEGTEEEDDTEGHRRRHAAISPEGTDDDTEGHRSVRKS